VRKLTPQSSSNEDTIREERLSRRRERETSEEQDARLKLSVLMHVSELSFVT